MRVTEGMSTLLAQHDLGRIAEKLLARQQQAATGQRLTRASDDPVSAANLVELDAQRALGEQHQRNIAHALSELSSADTALDSAGQVLLQARELALQLANGTMTAERRAEAEREVLALRDQLIAIANSRHGGTYLFAGSSSANPPFDPSGAYSGQTNQKQVAVDATARVATGVHGAEAFGAAGGVDAFDTLDELARALRDNDRAGISNSAATLERSREQVTRSRATLGYQMNTLSGFKDAHAEEGSQLSLARSELADVDALEVFTELANAQQALNAALEVTSRLLSNMSLVGRL